MGPSGISKPADILARTGRRWPMVGRTRKPDYRYGAAQRKPVIDVPATVTVLTAEQLDDNMVEEIKDLVRFEPGVPVNEDAVMPVARAMITVTAKLVLAGFDLTGLSHAVSGS